MAHLLRWADPHGCGGHRQRAQARHHHPTSSVTPRQRIRLWHTPCHGLVMSWGSSR